MIRSPESQENIDKTYYGLRLGMVVLAAMLFLSVAIQLATFHCMQSSISAYYYTPARPVFIAALCAIGAGLIIYRGNTACENAFLDFAGFLAFIVAFVPASFDSEDLGCNATNVPDISSAIFNNALALFLAGFLAILLGEWLLKPGYVSGSVLETPTRWSLLASIALLAAGAVLFLFNYELFASIAHRVAAGLFFLLILAVIYMNARSAQKIVYRKLYRTVFWVTFLFAVEIIIAGNVIWDTFPTWLFWAETVGIAGFVAFWLIQTNELGGFVDRSEATEAATEETARRSG